MNRKNERYDDRIEPVATTFSFLFWAMFMFVPVAALFKGMNYLQTLEIDPVVLVIAMLGLVGFVMRAANYIGTPALSWKRYYK